MEGQASLWLLVLAFTTSVGVCTSIGCPVRLPDIPSWRSHNSIFRFRDLLPCSHVTSLVVAFEAV